MFKKNIVLSSLLSVALFGLAACGGGGSDDSTPTTPGTGGTTNPGTGGGTTNPGTGGGTTPTTPTTPTPVNLNFASGTYIWQGSSSIYEIVVSDNSLYVLAPSLKPVLARIDNVNTFVEDKTITDAPAVIKVEDDEVLKAGTISITFDDADDIKELSAMGMTAPGLILTSYITFTGVANSTDLVALNGKLAGTDFSAFAVDAGYNLTATDKYGCTIDGKLTAQSNDAFHAELTYSGVSCVDAGSYEGTLWAYEHNSVTYLSWLAFNSDDTKLVTGRLDSKPAVLNEGVYTASGSKVLISKGNKVYYQDGNSGVGSFVFEYTPVSGTKVVEASGKGQRASDNNGTSAQLSIPAPEPVAGTIMFEDAVGDTQTVNFSDFTSENQFILKSATDLARTWDGIVINAAGQISGQISGCNIDEGEAISDPSGIWDISINMPACNIEFSGVGVVLKTTASSILVLSLFNDTANISINTAVTPAL